MKDAVKNQDFWEDVESLKDLLNEDFTQEASVTPVQGEKKPDFGPDIPAYATFSEEEHPPRKKLDFPPAEKMKAQPKSPDAGLRAALLFLYLILFAECAGLSWLGANWYTWMR